VELGSSFEAGVYVLVQSSQIMYFAIMSPKFLWWLERYCPTFFACIRPLSAGRFLIWIWPRCQ